MMMKARSSQKVSVIRVFSSRLLPPPLLDYSSTCAGGTMDFFPLRLDLAVSFSGETSFVFVVALYLPPFSLPPSLTNSYPSGVLFVTTPWNTAPSNAPSLRATFCPFFHTLRVAGPFFFSFCLKGAPALLTPSASQTFSSGPITVVFFFFLLPPPPALKQILFFSLPLPMEGAFAFFFRPRAVRSSSQSVLGTFFPDLTR